ncbi:MAG: hypothetical protein ACYDGR_03255 [Candidatus Dormibacteria bacterium]
MASFIVPTLPQVVNRTSGSISDRTAKLWVSAFFRSNSIEQWEAAHLIDSVMSSPSNPTGDSNPAAGLYGGYIRNMARLRGLNAVGLQDKSDGNLTNVAVVQVPEALRAQVSGPRRLSPFVIYSRVLGPTDVVAVFSDGHVQDEGGLASGQISAGIEAGEYRDDPILGPLWYREASFDCASDSSIRALCTE